MAVHKINIRANTLEKSKDKAPFLGVYQSNGTNNEEAMLPHVAEAAGQKDIQTRAILEGVFAAISKKNRADGPTRMHLPGGISAFVGITGSFSASDSAFDPEKNKVVQILGLSPKLRNELVNVTPEIVGEADGTRIELNRVFDLAQKIPPAVIYGRRPFRCQGINIVTTDEGARVFMRNRKGVEFDVEVDEVVSSQEFIAHTPDLLEPGDYHVVVETRGGNPDGTVREVAKPVKYLEVADPKRITIERCECYTDSEFAAIGDNFDGATGYRVEDGKRYVKGKFQVLEDPEIEIELWQDEDTDEPRVWHSNDTGEAPSGAAFTFKLTADPAKPDFVQETVTYEGTVS